jgi:hypothetical protein
MTHLGGILVGTIAVEVAACKLTEVGTNDVAVTGGTTQAVDFGDGIQLTFDSVDAGTARFTATSTPPPDAPPPFQSAGLYYDLVVPPHSGSVTVCLPYDLDAVAAGADLHLYHDEAGVGWVDVTTSIDTTNHIVCGATTSFSVFVVGFSPERPLAVNAPAAADADGNCVGHASLSATGGPSGAVFHWFLGDAPLGDGASITAALPLGANVVRVVAGNASKSATVTVVDRTPPSLSVAVSPSVLWPPDGKLVTIAPTPSVHDNCDAHPTVRVVDAMASAGAPSDIVVQPPSSIQLRAFRAGSETGGRTYTIHFSANDAAGNRATASAIVTVPHDKR